MAPRGPCAQHKVSSPRSGPAELRGGDYPPIHVPWFFHVSTPEPGASASLSLQKLASRAKAPGRLNSSLQPSQRLGVCCSGASSQGGVLTQSGFPTRFFHSPTPLLYTRLRKRGASRSVPTPQSRSLQRPGEGSRAFPQSLASCRWRWNPDPPT